MRPTRALALALTVLALPLAAGCGGDDGDETAAATEAETVAGAAEAPENTLSANGGGKLGPSFFSTPSENIACHVSRKAVRCDIRERTWKPPPKPASCKEIGLDWGQGIAVGTDRAEFVCAGDTTLGAPTILAYGQNSRRGDFRCHSGRRGITCSNAANGHGFFLSRQSYRIF